MNWSERKKRIRRYLRDIDGDIWNDTQLLGFWNQEQQELLDSYGQIEDIQTIRIPPMFQMSYVHDWEWKYSGSEAGYVYKAYFDYSQGDYICTHFWEMEQLARGNSTDSDLGYSFSHPWEAWIVNNTNRPPPVWVPHNFDKMMFLAHDKKAIHPVSKKSLTINDKTWQTRAGQSYEYWRDETLDNFLYIYPRPSTVSWYDLSSGSQVLFGTDDTVNQEAGIIIDADGFSLSQNEGLAIDQVDLENSLFAVFTKLPLEIEVDTDVCDWPDFLQKYIEYGVLERAYSANTEGQIKSLADYWGQRKAFGIQAIKKYKQKKPIDRDYRLRTKNTPQFSRNRQPRLPDEYPNDNIFYT